MELWFSEEHTRNVRLSLRVDKQLFSEVSEYQRVDIYESVEYGRVLVLDGRIMITERDEFIYHEMITHVPMCVNPSIKRVLLVGGGDGGSARELLKYDTIEKIDLVEIDEAVIRGCRRHIPQTAACLDNERVELFIGDGLKFIRRKADEYDLIIIDSTDPFGAGEGLFTKEFYGNCYNALKAEGIMINQHENPFYSRDVAAMQRAHKRLTGSFPIVRVYQINIPTYPAGQWLFGFASKKYHPTEGVEFAKWESLKVQTHCYNPKIHIGAFALPTYVIKKLRTSE